MGKKKSKKNKFEKYNRPLSVHECVSTRVVVEDELRTVSGYIMMDGVRRHVAIRYHIPANSGDVMNDLLRLIMPSILIDGQEVSCGKVAVWTRYLPTSELQTHIQAMNGEQNV